MANLNLNKVILGGRLTSDVELKQTQSGVSVCSFAIAVNRKYGKDGEQKADFHDCVAWRGTAEFISKYFRKGSSICIVGALETRIWTDKDGNKRKAVEVNVDEAYFVDSKADEQGGSNYIPDAYKPTEANFEDVDEDDPLPF